MNTECKTIKELLEERELEQLSPYATTCKNSKGRKRPRNEQFEIRTEFQRDRDKILHSKSFRRIKHRSFYHHIMTISEQDLHILWKLHK